VQRIQEKQTIFFSLIIGPSKGFSPYCHSAFKKPVLRACGYDTMPALIQSIFTTTAKTFLENKLAKHSLK